ELNYRIEVDGVSHRVDRDGGGVVHAPAPAVVVSIAVKAGDVVSAGDRLVVLESMKMEMQVTAPFSGKIRQVIAIPNVQVDTGTPLVQMDTEVTEQVTPGGQVVFGTSWAGEPSATDAISSITALRQLLLGFDIDPRRVSCPADSDQPSADELEAEILNIFVDICSLFQHEPEKISANGAEAASAEMNFFSYLRALETRGEALPPNFLDALRRALAHYGIHTLEPSPALEEALLWICKSHQRVEQQVAPIMSLLERRLTKPSLGVASECFKALLDRLIAMSNGVFPAINDLAREVRYRLFDQRPFEEARKQVYARAEGALEYLSANPTAADRAERTREMVECPQPVLGIFAGRFENADALTRELMLEVLTSRYYRIMPLREVHSVALDNRCVVRAEYDEAEKHVHLFTTHSDYAHLGDALRSLSPLLQQVPADHDVAVDLYVWNARRLAPPDVTQEEIQAVLNQAELPRPIQRIVVAAGCAGCTQGTDGLQHFTYQPATSGYQEEKVYRGLHPMIAKRLHLWRFSNFDIERLPSVEDVYLFHAIGRDNPKDERLFAVAEVRDVTALKDDNGAIVHLPHLERMISEAVASIRMFQSRRRSSQRLHWNRILLYLWPPLSLSQPELDKIVQNLAPATEGLGLEQVVVCARVPHPQTGELRDTVLRFSTSAGKGLVMTVRPATPQQPLKPLSEYDQKVVRMRQRGLIYPYEIIKMLTPASD